MPAVRRLATALLLGLAVAGCAAGPGATTASPSPSSPPAPTATPAASAAATPAPSPAGNEIKCDLGGHDAAYHIHALVGVRVGGQLLAPPANIGIGTDCMYWVHTHAADGIVHIEAPATVHPTLGDFLDFWEKTYPDDQLLQQARDAIAAGRVTVNDQPFTGDATGIVLEDRMRIILGS